MLDANIEETVCWEQQRGAAGRQVQDEVGISPGKSLCLFILSRLGLHMHECWQLLISFVPLSSNRIPSQADVTPGTRALHLLFYISAGVRGRSSRHTSPMRSPSGTTLTGGSSAWPAAWLQRQCQRT